MNTFFFSFVRFDISIDMHNIHSDYNHHISSNALLMWVKSTPFFFFFSRFPSKATYGHVFIFFSLKRPDNNVNSSIFSSIDQFRLLYFSQYILEICQARSMRNGNLFINLLAKKLKLIGRIGIHTRQIKWKIVQFFTDAYVCVCMWKRM